MGVGTASGIRVFKVWPRPLAAFHAHLQPHRSIQDRSSWSAVPARFREKTCSPPHSGRSAVEKAMTHHQRFVWRLSLILGVVCAFALMHGIRIPGYRLARASQPRAKPPRPLTIGDDDRDGLSDELEAELAARFAPIVILDSRERKRPASIPWLLSRIGRVDASAAGLPIDVRDGSADPRDWITYVHVYPRSDGAVNVQYWFFYAYNQGRLFFNHDADWEHVTVVLDSTFRPRGVAFAQHRNNCPGVFRDWSRLRKRGDHPIVLSALGTHASYPDQGSLALFERASACVGPEGCTDPIWRTWEGGGLINIGERDALLGTPALRDALRYKGIWGAHGSFPRSGPAPRGPVLQDAFVSDGFL